MTTAPEEASSAQRRLRQVPKPLIMCFIFSLIGIMKMRVLTQKYKPDISEKYYHHRVKGTGADTQDDDIGNKTRRQNMRTPESNLTHTCLSDVSLPKATTHLDGRPIPKTIHFIVQSKCLPMEVANAHTKHWESISDHSVLYHDQTFIDAYMAQPRKDFPAVAQKYKCAMDPMAKMDLAKLMLLWDNGGSAVDFGHIAGPAFQDGKYISDTDECMFEVDEELNVNPRFLACKPRHSALYAAIVRFITVPFVDYTPLFPYTQKTRSETIGFVRSFMTMGNENEREGRGQFEGDGIVLINATAIDGDLFTSLPMKDGTFNETRLQLIPKQEQEQCNAILRNDSYKVDIKGLLDLVEYGKENSTCPNSLHFIGSKFNERSIVEGRKIPKIVHMTSKSRCFAKEFVDAIDAWRFEDYSILIHDDATADKLMSREWPEFPLLQEARSCITTGAGMADLWRYLILWEYGGLYTDIDNRPGPMLRNGSAITDDTDSFFEVDKMGGFPSQYFFIASPHHPVAFHMVQHTINRLMEITNIGIPNTPFVTGPAAVKCGVFSTINNGYPKQGLYAGFNNRSITVVGDRRRKSAEREFVLRSIIPNKKNIIKTMGMLHFSKEENQNKREKNKMHSCLHENYHNFKNSAV